MSPTLRSVVGVVVGAVAALLLVAGIETIGHLVYPPPAGLDYSDAEELRQYVGAMPVGAFLFVLAAWLIATLAGALVACFIARKRPPLIAGIIAALMLIATARNLVAIPHPFWFSLTALIGILIMAFLAGRMAPKEGAAP
jgi:hypothetical protein